MQIVPRPRAPTTDKETYQTAKIYVCNVLCPKEIPNVIFFLGGGGCTLIWDDVYCDPLKWCVNGMGAQEQILDALKDGQSWLDSNPEADAEEIKER